ncbi:PIN domain nuclease [Anaerolineales bacterium HSG24]|nr:PIN domain nuclease [Anaerolineales bacterium HSG24]
MSIEFIFRLVGMVVFAILGTQIAPFFGPVNTPESTRLMIIMVLSGSAIGLLSAPYLTIYPYNFVKNYLKRIPAPKLVFGVAGLVVALGIAALLYSPLSALPTPYGNIAPIITSILLAYIGASIAIMRHEDIANYIKPSLNLGGAFFETTKKKAKEDKLLLDTSVIIDGRIADISQTGFIRSTMLVPRFVLAELQYIADSADSLKRARGRRGLDILKQLQEDSIVMIEITDLDIEGVRKVDEKLMLLAQQIDCPIVTNDYNLNSVAKLQGILILNINDLANAVKTVILPSETMAVKIIQEGKEYNQGIAYLSDGTMIVVEQGKKYINRRVDVEVTKVLQTSAGRMIFAKVSQNGI